ncbi:Beta-galactosidase C-terminal domain [Pectobacterium araliae]|uniref:Beta-galactosidase C-terminal domain n=1 Tax=Pectobacterium araliae TaxID=3073862 RepID=UPI003D16F73F
MPYGVVAHRRDNGESEFIFVQNYTATAQQIALPATYEEMTTGSTLSGFIDLSGYGCRILRRALQ